MSRPIEADLVVVSDEGWKCISGEELNLRTLGRWQIPRASHIEPDLDVNWFADVGPVEGPKLGPFRTQSEALGAERGWLVRTASSHQ